MIWNTVRQRVHECRLRIFKVPGWRRIYDAGSRPVMGRVDFAHYDLIGPKVVINEVNR